MKIGIITPMAEEKLSLIAALDNTKTKQHGIEIVVAHQLQH